MPRSKDSFDVAQLALLERVAAGAALAEVLAAIVSLIERQAHGMLCSVLLLEPGGSTLSHGAAPSLPVGFVAAFDGHLIGPDVGSCGAAAFLRERVVVEDIATHPNWVRYREAARSAGIRASWSTPIWSPHHDVLGTFAMYYRESRGPTAREIEWVAAATHLAAIAIVHARSELSLQESETRAQQLARLYAVSSSVGEALVRFRDPQQLYDVACRIAVEQGLAALAWIGTYDAALDRVVPQARYGNDDGYVDAIHLRLRDPSIARGPAALAIDGDAVAVSNDIANDPSFHWKHEALRRGLGSCAVFPLRIGGWAPGVFAIYGASPGFFRAEEIRVLSALADNIAFAVESAGIEAERRRLFEELGEREQRLRLLHGIGEAMRATTDPDRVLPVALRMLGEHLRVSRCTFVNVGPDGDRCTIPFDYTDGCVSIVGPHRLSDLGEVVSARLRRDGGPVVVSDVDAELPPADAASFSGVAIKAFVSCSLVREGVLRAMMAIHQSVPRSWKRGEVELLQEVVERCWATIEQRAAEAKLRQNEALLRIAGSTARLGGWSIELHEDHVTWSDEVCAIHDMPPGSAPLFAEALGFTAPEFHQLIINAFQACARDGTPIELELQIITARERRVWVRVLGRAERNAAGAIVRLQGALQDVDERRRLEEQLHQSQKMEAVGQLAGGVAHDFNNLLSVILSYASLIVASREPGDALRADVEQIAEAGERAAELTRQLLTFSRQQRVRTRVVDPSSIVVGLEKMLRRVIGEDITLTLLASETPGRVLADRGQIEQVVMNLVVNARDAMPSGGNLTISTRNVELDEGYAAAHPVVRPGRYHMISVTDTGEGMDAATRSRVFDPFFTTKPKGKGTGLGLSTVYGIVTQAGGHVWLESEPGRGTTVEIYLPRIDAPLEQDDTGEPPRAVQLRGSETVLVVEDVEQVRTVICSVLRRAGYRVIEAQNAGEALLVCEQHDAKIDLMLTDVVMPRMSGPELAERIASLRPDTRVLFMSGYTENTLMPRGGEREPISFLPKPIMPEPLLRAVRECLDRDADSSARAMH